MQTDRPTVLSIAGFDPCGGAGVLADIKTFEQLKVRGMSIVTAQTIQTESKVVDVHWQDVKSVVLGITNLMQYYEINVVKIGIVPNHAFLNAIINCVKGLNENVFIIWDPVFKSSSGFEFFSENDLKKITDIFKKTDLITPNYDEYILLKPYLKAEKDVALFIKGGHRKENIGRDILRQKNSEIYLTPHVKNVYAKHGSGCVLSSAIAAYIASNIPLEEACQRAKRYVEQFLNSNPTLLGHHNND